jgi:hypothetical protein
MAPNGTKVQDKKNHQDYESLEMYSSEDEYEFETLKDYESDDSDTYLAPVFMQNLESPKLLESIEKSWCETQKFQTTFDTKENLQSQQQPNDSCIPKKGSQTYIDLVRQCKQSEAKVILKRIISTNKPSCSPQRSSQKTASDVLYQANPKCKMLVQSSKDQKSILAEKELQGFQLNKNEKPKNLQIQTTLNENFKKWKNSKSEKEINELRIKCKSDSEDRWKRKLAGINTTSNTKKPKNCENSINDGKQIFARKSTDKEKSIKVDKAANLKQSNKAKYSASREKSTSGQKSIAELMSEVVESSGRFFCPENCVKSFGIRGHLPKHLLSHRPKNQWPFVCLFCGQTFQARADLPKHFKTSKHNNDSRIPKQDTPAWVEMIAKSVNKI